VGSLVIPTVPSVPGSVVVGVGTLVVVGVPELVA